MKLLNYIPALAWALLVLTIGGRSDVPSVDSDLPLDKIAHFLMYGVLGAVAAVGWLRAARSPAAPVVIALSLCVGAIDELHQRTVPGRTSDVADFVADTAGVLTGFAIMRRLGTRIRFVTGDSR